jgi:hypothetical protein
VSSLLHPTDLIMLVGDGSICYIDGCTLMLIATFK